MAGKSIADLPMPPAEYRPDRTTFRADGRITFETPEQVRGENMLRAALLTAQAQHLDKRSRKTVLLLARQLKRQAEGLDDYDSPASAQAYRRVRKKLVAAAWQIVDSVPRDEVATATLIKRGWNIPAHSLASCDPRVFLAQVRTDIRRSGHWKPGSFLIGGLHGDFEPNACRYQLHVHVLAIGPAIGAVDRLRDMSRYRSTSDDDDDHVRQRVRLSRAALINLPDPITYLFQPFWPSRWIGTSPEGESIRQRIKARIPEPYHSEWLLWMDRWRFDDLVLLMGARIGRKGLILSDQRSCT